MLSEKKVLLVDGDEGIRKSLSLFLQSRGYNLHAVENATLALMAIKKKPYDIIICEQFLPDMNGLNFFEIINNRYHGVIKILITTYGSTTALGNICEKGIDFVLTKPFSGDEVEGVMSRLVKTKNVKNKSSCT